MTVSLNFFKQYHAFIVKALGEDSKKVSIKIGQAIADSWLSNVGTFKDNTEFAQSFENYLRYQLSFATHVRVHCSENDYILSIKGCAICHGNEILRKENAQTMCPIIQAARHAAVKGLAKNVITKGIGKSGVIGECVIELELE